MTISVKRQNPIDFVQTGYYMAGQSFRQKRRRLDKKLIEKTENDRQVAKNWYHIRQELTELSMWITLWKLGISQIFLDNF